VKQIDMERDMEDWSSAFEGKKGTMLAGKREAASPVSAFQDQKIQRYIGAVLHTGNVHLFACLTTAGHRRTTNDRRHRCDLDYLLSLCG